MEFIEAWHLEAFAVFFGFLGVGNHDLVCRDHDEVFQGSSSSRPFDAGSFIKTQPFSTEQVNSFISLIAPLNPLSEDMRVVSSSGDYSFHGGQQQI